MTDNNKRYRLLKDLPNVNAGEILKLSKRGQHYTCKDTKGFSATFSIPLIENNPLWFEEVKNIKPPLGLIPKHIWDEQRIWDISEAIQRYNSEGKEVPQEWISERHSLMFPHKSNPSPQIKEPVQDTKGECGWEILSFKTNGWGGLLTKGKEFFGNESLNVSEEDLIHSSAHTIHSVRRLRDNEILSVGSKDYSYGKPCKILSFRVMENGCMWCCVEFGNGNKYENVNILSLDKLPTTDKPVLFTTLDGKDIREGEEYWGVFIDVPKKWVGNKYCVSDKTSPRFSTEQAAIDFLTQKLKL